MDGRSPHDRPYLHAGVLAAVAAALLLTKLTCPLLEPEETRYAEIPRQMLAEGSFVEPVWHGQPYYHKPPLLYWLVMLSYTLFGVHDWAARLVPALASCGTVGVTWLWGRRAFGPGAGFTGALILLLCGRFIYLGRMLTIDPLLCLWVTAALASAHLAVREETLRWRWWLLSAVVTGLGLLTKGPVAAVLVLVPVVLFQLVQWRRPSVGAVAVFVAVAIGVAAPWYAAMVVTNSEAAGDFFWLHHVQRYLDPVDHEEPWWFFVPGLLVGCLPWSLLLVPLGRRLLRERPSELVFPLLALAWCVVFFSLSGCKRAVYILPALPWLAICLEKGAFMFFMPRFLRPVVVGVFVVLFLGVQLWLPGYHRRFALRGQVRRHADNPLTVFCYPKRWDSVTFYLGHDNVRLFTKDQRLAMASELQRKSRALMFVKTRHLDELLEALPAELEFVPTGRQGPTMTVGTVQPRGGP
jgi:4-amino-4-deoxy-L-arabinose transferase-like glycosyltransferase